MSTNVSKEKRDLLIKKIEDIKTFIQSSPQDDNTAQLLTYISDIEKDIKGKKYGLVFEEHREGIDELLENNLPVLTEDADLFIDNGGQMNFLIEGDNLASLKLLEKTHKGRIDLIYIDPPYNTGAKNWIYDNDYVDSNDLFRHSKWLSFMKNRLKSAYNLLSCDGIIIVTIDDYEVDTLTLLMDELFGEEHRLATIIIKNNPSGRSTVSGVSISHEYALFYCKNDNVKLGRLPRNEAQIARYKETDSNGRFEWVNFRKHGGYKEDAPSMYYPIYVKKDGSSFRIPKLLWNERIKEYSILEESETDELVSLPIDEEGRQRRWKWGLDRALTQQSDMSVRLDRNKVPAIYIKARMKEEGMLPLTVWDSKEYSSTEYGANLLSKIMGGKKFDYPKSLYAVIDCLKVGNAKKDTIILDFFAGSGTTGHAVMKLNAEDGGNRKFILCTNNENNICRDVTYERIKRVIAKDDYKASLKYFKVEYLPISDKLYYEYADELLLHIRELVELENGINFNGNTEIAIVLTEKELDNFTQNIPKRARRFTSDTTCCRPRNKKRYLQKEKSKSTLYRNTTTAIWRAKR